MVQGWTEAVISQAMNRMVNYVIIPQTFTADFHCKVPLSCLTESREVKSVIKESGLFEDTDG